MAYEFKEYSSIENSYQQGFIDRVIELGYGKDDVEWVVQEKVDGACFMVAIDENDNIHYARRTAVLKRGESFNNFEQAMRLNSVEDKLRKIKEILGFPVINLYGELAGGKYPDPEKKYPRVGVIQGRVQYAPFVFFYPFDISYVAEDGTRHVLDFDTFTTICNTVDLIQSITLHRGTLQSCLEYPNDYESLVSQRLFELPPIENNITEGNVIKPVIPCWLPNGSRIIIKNKNDLFKEKMKSKTGKRDKVAERDMTELENEMLDNLDQYKTESRLYSVLSKIGTVTSADFGKIMGAFMKDLFEDFDKEYAEQVKMLEDGHTVDEFLFSKVTKRFQKQVQEWIRPIFIAKLSENKYNDN